MTTPPRQHRAATPGTEASLREATTEAHAAIRDLREERKIMAAMRAQLLEDIRDAGELAAAKIMPEVREAAHEATAGISSILAKNMEALNARTEEVYGQLSSLVGYTSQLELQNALMTAAAQAANDYMEEAMNNPGHNVAMINPHGGQQTSFHGFAISGRNMPPVRPTSKKKNRRTR